MVMLATTTISIYTLTTTDDYGDEKDDNTLPSATNVPASIIERSRKVYVPADDRIQTVRYVTGRVRSGTVISAGNRIKDENSRLVYDVEAVHQVQSVGYKADVVLDLIKI